MCIWSSSLLLRSLITNLRLIIWSYRLVWLSNRCIFGKFRMNLRFLRFLNSVYCWSCFTFLFCSSVIITSLRLALRLNLISRHFDRPWLLRPLRRHNRLIPRCCRSRPISRVCIVCKLNWTLFLNFILSQFSVRLRPFRLSLICIIIRTVIQALKVIADRISVCVNGRIDILVICKYVASLLLLLAVIINHRLLSRCQRFAL